MARKTKAEAQETRHQLLDAATRVFRERGVARTTLQDVASAAGMTRGAVYWHFKDKADLFNAMMDRVVLPWEEAHEVLMANASDPLATLLRLALDPLQRLQGSPEVQQVFLIAMQFTEYTEEFAKVREHQQASVDNYIEEMHRLFMQAADAGSLRHGVAPADAAITLFALVDGLMRNWLLRPQGFSLEAASRLAVQTLLAGLFKASKPDAPAPAPRKSRARPARST